ncbi:DDE family transposase [Thermolongibacillus altinsuensis]|uniref:DDE family transposase n=1 Tax=Thermolongibacillus altinsuensis TaxID=575256 RepID=A0A4R1QT38_9BACL|nr:transposase [Thermolongibacillus altinsuensis]TCL53260.1 DDE family transposase [Thermolongibacillus altinsuensis]
MQEHFYFTTNRAKLQKQYAAILSFVSAQLSSIQIHLQRRNRHLLKQEDEVIITVHVLGKLLGFTSERAWHRFVIGNLFPKALFPERSHCRALGFAIKWVRHQLAKRGQHHAYAVVDSLPIELCHSARMYRVTYNLGDKGYISQKLQKKLYEEHRVAFWTTVRKNQRIRQSDAWKHWMKRKRKVVETVFSILVDPYRITEIRANSVSGFETALDGILLAYSLVVLGLVER